jgi:metallo-beta-lactamase family protein
MADVPQINLSFHGAAREVTGSCHLLEVDGTKILLDCGLYQGGKERHERNREPFPFAADQIDCVVLSHAHIDHSGRLPLLVKAGYDGPILCTAPTASLCEILLRDSGHIQEEDARWKIKRLLKAGEDASWVKPLYTVEDAEIALGHFASVEFDETVGIASNVDLRFIEAGHILGAAIVELTIDRNGGSTRLVFSGDLGVTSARLLGAPEGVACPDYLIMESTYGDRVRERGLDPTEQLYEIISETVERGGKVVIPSFAVGRTQEILARINDLIESGRLEDVPIYVDSPMAVRATSVFSMYPEYYSERAQRGIESGDEPLEFPGLHLVASVEESKALNFNTDPAVIISASGMCDAGRVKHHLANNIGNPRNTVAFVGYQALNSLGRAILTGKSPVRIFGEKHRVRARVEMVEGLSAHADLEGLKAWYAKLGDNPRKTFIVHGEEDVAVKFVATVADEFGADVIAPVRNESFALA